MNQPLDPLQVGQSAYLNSALLSARIDALQDFIVNPPENASWTRQECWDAALLRAVTRKAEEIEAYTQRIQIAKTTPKLHIAN